MSVNDASRNAIDDCKVMLEIVAKLTDNSRGIIYNHIMFKEQAIDTCERFYTDFYDCTKLDRLILIAQQAQPRQGTYAASY